MRFNAAEDHLLGAKRFKGFARDDEMSVMNRIERAAVDCDLHQKQSAPETRFLFSPGTLGIYLPKV